MTSNQPRLSRRSAWAADQPIGYLMHKALQHPELVSLAAGFVDQASLPVDQVRSAALALTADMPDARVALQYGTTSGDATLREQVLARLRQADGPAAPSASVERVVLTAGSNQMLWLLSDLLLDPGDIVLCDSPTYFVFMGIVKNMGARAVGIASDDGGMQPAALEQELQRIAARGEISRVKAVYLVSYFDNPRSVSLADDRRAKIVDIAKRYSQTQPLFVIEDAAYRDLRYSGGDVPSVWSHDHDGTHVIHAGTFSKSFAPGVRVGYGVLPASLTTPLLELKGNLDFGSPHLSQRLVSKVLELGLFEPHVETLQRTYRSKLAAMLDALDTELGKPGLARYSRPTGGLYVWAELLGDIDTGTDGALFGLAIEEGMLYVPGIYAFADAATAPRSFMRLSFGVQSEARIAEGVRRLARAIRRVPT